MRQSGFGLKKKENKKQEEEKVTTTAIGAVPKVSHEFTERVVCLLLPPPGGSHPEHGHGSGPLLPAVSRGEPPQSAETHRGRDQDRGGEPGAAAGDWRVPGPPETRRSVRAGRSGEQTSTAWKKHFAILVFFFIHLCSKLIHAEFYIFIT